MRYASFVIDDRRTFGPVSADGRMLGELSAPGVLTLKQALAEWGLAGLREKANRAALSIPATSVQWEPPIPEPAKILCVGINFGAHASEGGREVPQYPSLFPRFADSLVGHEQPVYVPRCSQQLDYEAELAVVVGSRCRHVDEAHAMAHVAGYSCFAENSVRDFQKHNAQVTPGKNFFSSGGWGPWLVTPDEAGDLAGLEITGRLNDEVVQRDVLGRMIFSVARIISYVSQFTPLSPGDVIATGTPAGVGFLRKPPIFMKPGDRFEVDIGPIGRLTLPVQQEPS